MKDGFVIMPFSQTVSCSEADWTDIYENVFNPALMSCGFSCERARPLTGSLMETIVERLRNARLVLADITDRNTNVFYELGIRHSLRSGTVIVSQGQEHVPSDLSGMWFLKYGLKPRQVVAFKEELKRVVLQIEELPDRADNPVAAYLEKENQNVIRYVHRENLKKLGALYTELTGNKNAIDRMMHVDGKRRPFVSHECLGLLLQTFYIDIGPDLFKKAYELGHMLRLIENGDRDQAILSETQAQLAEFILEIVKIGKSVNRGEFSEPRIVSMMEWRPM